MTTTTTTTPDRRSAGPRPGGGFLSALVPLSASSVLAELWQFITAGQLLPGDSALTAHQAGAIMLHVASGLTLLAAFLAGRRGAAPTWLWLLAGVVFGLTFVQAATGGRETLWIHVPGAMVVTAGSVWVLAAATGLAVGSRRAARTRASAP